MARAAQSRHPRAPVAKPSVLVGDDESSIRSILCELLTAPRYEVRRAPHAAEAMSVIDSGFRPTLAVVDMMMPVMGGAQFVAALRASAAGAGVSVLIISASVGGPPAGVQGFLRKPFEMDELL